MLVMLFILLIDSSYAYISISKEIRMRLIIFIMAILLSMVINCSDRGPFDPTRYLDGYSGITYTDTAGNIIGSVDKSDWGVRAYDSPDFRILHLGGFRRQRCRLLDCETFFANPAFPNPSDSVFRLEFGLSNFPGAISFVIKDQEGRIVYDIFRNVVGGLQKFNWQPVDDNGRKLPYGIYRVFYCLYIGPENDLIPHYYGYGDLWYIDPVPVFN